MWRDDHVPDQMRVWSDTWKDNHPEWEHVLWTNETILSFIQDKYSSFMDTYIKYEMDISRSDAARYLILYEFGGLYCDMDTQCHTNISHLIADDVVLFQEHPWHGLGGWPEDQLLLTNSIFYSKPGAKFMKHCVSGLTRAFATGSHHGEAHHQVMMTTGGGYLTTRFNMFQNVCNVTVRDHHHFEHLSKQERLEAFHNNDAPTYGCGVHWNVGGWIQDTNYKYKLTIE